MKFTLYIFIYFFFGFGLTTYGQTDTIVDGMKYNYVTLHNNGLIKKLGNYQTQGKKNIKHGHWAIYDKSGSLIKTGNYEKGNKSGVWKESARCNLCYWTGSYNKNGKKDGDWFDGVNRFKVYKNGKMKGVKIVSWGE